MIAHLIETIRNTGTLTRTVLILSQQLKHATLAGQLEEARADRAELLAAERADHIAELEAQIRDWNELAGDPAADALPDLHDAGEDARAPVPTCACDEAAQQRARADAQHSRAEQAERERDAAARAAGAHLRTIEHLREQLAEAHRAIHRPMRTEQIPAVLAAEDEPDSGPLSLRGADVARTTATTREDPQP